MSDNTRKTLAQIGEHYLRNPVLLEEDEGQFTDETGAKWAYFAHGNDTGMQPFYSAGQLKAAMEDVWTASRLQAIEEAAKVCEPKRPRPCGCERCDCGNSTNTRMVAEWDEAASLVAAIRNLTHSEDGKA